MKTNNWREEKLKYTKCSVLNIPVVSTRLFYKFAHTIRDKHLAPCKLIEVNGGKLTVQFGEDERATMEDKIQNFFTLNVC